MHNNNMKKIYAVIQDKFFLSKKNDKFFSSLGMSASSISIYAHKRREKITVKREIMSCSTYLQR